MLVFPSKSFSRRLKYPEAEALEEDNKNTTTSSKFAVAETHGEGQEILSGQISILSNRGATVILENGSTISLNPRSWHFAQAQGLQTQLGDSLLLTGFYENGQFEIVHLRNLDNGSVAQIRDEDGHPLWVSGGHGE